MKKKNQKPIYCESGYNKPCMSEAVEVKGFEDKYCKRCYYYNKVTKYDTTRIHQESK